MTNTVIKKAEQIAEDFLQETAKDSYQILGKGIVNEVCVVETNSNKVVIRMNSKDTYPTFLKEKWCIEQALAAGIPSPEVLSVGIFGETAYMIQTFVDGDNGLDSPKHRDQIWRKLGEYLHIIHNIPVKGFGENLDDAGQGVFSSPPHPGSDAVGWAT
ncbi:phosphotransferase [Lederbergia graminis]|uniref:Phosphotransferase n=1 Tax=Lederbergia graminis TaxID=735518 RepID=A0ABW0LEQ4_9BACI